jgi:hypothetical protein
VGLGLGLVFEVNEEAETFALCAGGGRFSGDSGHQVDPESLAGFWLAEELFVEED